MTDPIAQGIQEAVPSEVTPASEAAAQPSGAEARINELTAKYREAERMNQEATVRTKAYEDQVSQLVQALAAQQSQRPAHEPEAPAINIDPETQKLLNYVLSPIQKQLKDTQAQLAQMQQVGGAQQEFFHVDALGQQSKAPPEVVAAAKQTIMAWRAKGISASVANAKDALLLAAGEVAMRAFSGQAPAGTGYPPPVPSGGMAQTAPQAQKLPPNFNSLSNDQQLAAMEKLGFGDIPW
jgi:hypothetical protein